MFARLKQFVAEEQLFHSKSKLILGVSGGIDSIVLLDLLDQYKIDFVIAHCNFQLRNEDSLRDETFVRELAEKYRVEFYLKTFDTEDYAKVHGVSIEMAARDLRYDWFESLRRTLSFDAIAVAHHADDVLETFFMNLNRGTGIRGVSGIKPQNGNVIRPLLYATREEIEAYAQEIGLPFRTDYSNADTKFRRNFIRHNILPNFDLLSESFRKNMKKSIHLLQETETIYLQKIEEMRTEIVDASGLYVRISKEKLRQCTPIHTYLYEFLRPYGFKNDLVKEIVRVIDSTPGKQFISESHRLVNDRKDFIIQKLVDQPDQSFYIECGDVAITEPLKLEIQTYPRPEKIDFKTPQNIAFFDADLLEFPLVIRKWKKGEYFRPLGMKGYKKLSDFFIDEKKSLPEKEATWLLTSADKVVWVIGMRIDDRYKITPETKQVCRIEFSAK